MGSLLAEGHAHAMSYPLAYVWNEVLFAQKRRRTRLRVEMTLFYAAITSGVNGGNSMKDALEMLKDGS